LIPSGITERAGRDVAEGALVLVGTGVAVGGTVVGTGSGVLVAGIAGGVTFAGFSKGTVEQPAAETTTTSMQKDIINVFMDLSCNIFYISFN